MNNKYEVEITNNTNNTDTDDNNLNEITELFNLLRTNKWDEFNKLLAKTTIYDINIRDQYNNYFLTYAILYNRPEIVANLIKIGARIDITDSEDRCIIYNAIKYNYTEIIDILLKTNLENIGVSLFDIRDKNANVAIHYAIIFNNYDTLQKILDFGASPNVANNDGFNSLHLAVYTRSLKACELIINYNIDINSRCKSGETVLHIACNLQLIDIVKLLLNNGINVNIQDYDHEFTALHYCVNLNNKELIKLLLENNANINIQDMVGNTAIHYAVNENNLECLEILLSSKTEKPNLNLWNFDGHIPLHIVLTSSLTNIDDYLKILLPDSNVNIQDNSGDTCLHIICYKNIWQNDPYKDILEKKRLDIFITNKMNERPVDYVKKSEIELFINMVSKSYLFRLRRKNKQDHIWSQEWENLCKKELYINNITAEEKEILHSSLNLPDMKILDIKTINNTDNNDVCYSIVKTKLLAIINDKNIKYCSKSFPIKQGNMCIKMTEGSNLNVCTFTGSTLDILIGLIYLLKKFPDACSTFSKNFSENKELCKFYKSIGIIMNTHCEFLNFEIVWVYHKLYLSDDFYDNFKKCYKRKTTRFIIIPLGIELREGSHANYIIFDKKTNEVERFEPHGSHAPTGLNYNPTLLDDILESRFKELDTINLENSDKNNSKIKYIRPKEYLPKIGFQLMDVAERKKKKIGDPGGFCALWAIWYVDMRLTYRDMDRKTLIKHMISSIKSQNISFKNLIRNYAKNIIDIRDLVLNRAGIDINDWLNDQFTDAQIDIILKELGNYINTLVV